MPASTSIRRITSYNVCYTKLLRLPRTAGILTRLLLGSTPAPSALLSRDAVPLPWPGRHVIELAEGAPARVADRIEIEVRGAWPRQAALGGERP